MPSWTPLSRTASTTSSVMSRTWSPPDVRSCLSIWKTFIVASPPRSPAAIVRPRADGRLHRPEHPADDLEQLLARERLADDRRLAHALEPVRAGDVHDDRVRLASAHLPRDDVAGHARDHHVEQEEVEWPGRRLRERVVAVGHRHDL